MTKHPMSRIAAVILFIAATGPAVAQANRTAQAAFVSASGAPIGTAALMQTPHGVRIALDLRGLPPGAHAFHVHKTGRCDVAAKFESAGPHFAPGRTSHGHEVASGPHAGDMINQFVGGDGRLRAEVLNADVTLRGGAASLFDADGSALMLHAGPDDYRSQPAGAAGGRIACAVVRRNVR